MTVVLQTAWCYPGGIASCLPHSLVSSCLAQDVAAHLAEGLASGLPLSGTPSVLYVEAGCTLDLDTVKGSSITQQITNKYFVLFLFISGNETMDV